MTETLLGAVILASLVLYALLAGADYGGGILDLFARGPRAEAQRRAVEEAIGPIWEANHVWLILVVVVLFTGFPEAFATISTWLFVPLVMLLVGIVLRGAAFTFRSYDRRDDLVQRRWGRIFAAASLVAPLMLGIVVGSLASGSLRSAPGGGWFSWAAPFPVLTGGLAASLFAYLAAAYLTVETEGALREDFRTRAIAAGVAVFLLALATGAASYRAAPLVFEGLTRRRFSVPLHLATGVAAIGAFAALLARRWRAARSAAAAQVALIVVGWGASQYPYLLVPDLTLASAAAPRATQRLLLEALGLGAVALFPSLYFLFRVFKGGQPPRPSGPPP